ncbi:MAG TPA: glycerol-3-phosphate 1-O-acyltransferase PlsY [Candidatus Binatia bacterium]|nr:glycerol-3-phosphate 1-O-acyltransferase PlsY [Candidatus Binatia bacterium]
MPTLVIIAAVSYLLGSIPFGYLLVRLFRGEDVRLSGSGNIGATNVSRKSPALGALTLILDALKGSAAVVFARYVSPNAGPRDSCMALAALFAVLGHMFPVWLKFRGGKGVATGLGAFLVIAPNAVLVAAAVFVCVLALFRYVSLASIISVALFPLAAGWLHPSSPSSMAYITLTSLLIVAMHHQNIRRLLSGTENRLGAKHA